MKVIGRVKGKGNAEGDIVELEPGEKVFYRGFYYYTLHDKEGNEIASLGKNYPYACGFLILALFENRNHENFSWIYLFDPRLIASCIKVSTANPEEEQKTECVPFESLDEAVRYVRKHLKTVNADPDSLVYEKDPATGFFCLHEMFKGNLTLL